MVKIENVRIKLVRESAGLYCNKYISCPEDAAEIAAKHFEDMASDREVFSVMLLDVKNRVIGINVVSIGSLSASVVHPREVFKAAILANAASVILTHNHPSGESKPSREDIEVTRRMVQVGRIMDIHVLDHIIIGDGTGESFSFKGNEIGGFEK